MRSEEEVVRAMDTYADLVRRLCLVRLKSREDTEDIFQTVFLKYLQHTKPFANAEHEKAWFIQVTLNACRDLLRFWARRPTVPLEALAAQAALALAVLTAAGGLAYATPAATVTVSADSGHCERLLSDGGEAGLTCYALDPETAQAARDAGLSLGKYRAYLTLSALDPTVTQDEAGEMTMGELQQCIDACQGHGSGQGQQGSEQGQTAGETAAVGQGYGGHHGQGHGHGHE